MINYTYIIKQLYKNTIRRIKSYKMTPKGCLLNQM